MILAGTLRCKVLNLLITYLGLPFGANPKKVSTWKLVIEKVEKRLPMWKAKTLSKAERLVLIRVLNNPLVYYRGLFKTPVVVMKKIIQLQRSFF